MPAFRSLFRKGKQSKDDGQASAASERDSALPSRMFPTGLKLLYEPESAIVDIVFVHGLTGDREKTWRAKGAESPWPQTLLPTKVPQARILTFGYDANVTDWRAMVSNNRIGNHAKNLLAALATYRENGDTNHRPILFVAHSLGGLVCEDALLASRNSADEHLQHIVTCTRGILFLGTPHAGSGFARWAELTAKSIGLITQTNPDILEVLKTDSEVLARIQTDFHTMTRAQVKKGYQPIEITCFFEELPLPGIGEVVPMNSATLPAYPSIGIRRNHKDMTKFELENDSGFASVAGELQRWVKELTKVKSTAVPRNLALQKLQAEQRQGPYYGRTAQVRTALYGLGGTGKTQIALTYAYWIQENFPGVSIFWVHASNPERFYQAFGQIAEICQIPGYRDPKEDILSLVKVWLERKDQCPWLMIIDNADDKEMFFSSTEVISKMREGTDRFSSGGDLGRYIPECSHGSIVVTTRNKQAGVKLTKGHRVMEIGEIDSAESSQLIRQKLEDDGLDPNHMALLTARLAYLSLALVQAAAFIQENSLSLTSYLELLDHSDNSLVGLLSEPFEEVGRDSTVPNPVAATWMVSFRQIREQYSYAADLFSLMSFFDRQGIPKLFLSYWSKKNHSRTDQQCKDRSEDPLELEKALGILKAFSFISEAETDENLDMHRLIQLVMRKWLITEGKSRQWASEALLIVSELYPYGQYENWTVCRHYLPHVLAILSLEEWSSTKEATAKGSLLHRAAKFMADQGQFNKAEGLVTQAAETRKMVLGQEHPDTLRSMNNLAMSYWDQGRFEEAEALQVQVTETRKRVLGQEHPDTLRSMNNLATSHGNQGRFGEAEALQVQVTETMKRVLGQEHPDTLRSMNDFALTWKYQGHDDRALNMMRKCVDLQKKVLGVDHPDTKLSLQLIQKWQEPS